MRNILKKNVKVIILVAFLFIFCNILNAAHPLVMKKILDIDLKAENIKNLLTNLVLLYVATHVIYIISKSIKNSIVNKTMAKILKELREELFSKVLKWDMTTYQKYNSSEIYTRFTADIDEVSSLFLGSLQILLNNLLYIVIMVIFMFFADTTLAIIGCIAMILNAFVL